MVNRKASARASSLLFTIFHLLFTLRNLTATTGRGVQARTLLPGPNQKCPSSRMVRRRVSASRAMVVPGWSLTTCSKAARASDHRRSS